MEQRCEHEDWECRLQAGLQQIHRNRLGFGTVKYSVRGTTMVGAVRPEHPTVACAAECC